LAESAADSNRAYVGPFTANMDKPQAGEPLKIRIIYWNMGHQPAPVTNRAALRIFPDPAWADGTVSAAARAGKEECMGLANVSEFETVMFPTSPDKTFIYTYDGAKVPPNEKMVASDKLVSGEATLPYLGCFAYRVTSAIRHTAFCFYYNSKTVDPGNLAFCPFGQDAD
jgi:hypothetical protein